MSIRFHTLPRIGHHDQWASISASDLSLRSDLLELGNRDDLLLRSFESLSEGLQNALWELGGVPHEHRTDRMSAAVNNLCDGKEFTRAYEGLLGHYQIRGQKTQAGQVNENGDVEQRHYRFKQSVDQALMLRGSRGFPRVAAYQLFLSKLFTRLNAGRQQRYLEEVVKLRPLPEQRLDTARRERVRVSPGSLVTVHRNYYSVHSRLIGEMVEARVLPDTVEIWYADRKVEELPRLRGRGKHQVDLRHSCASQLMMNGTSLIAVKEILGHESLKTTMRYTHLSPEYVAHEVKVLDRVLPKVDERTRRKSTHAKQSQTDQKPIIPRGTRKR